MAAISKERVATLLQAEHHEPSRLRFYYAPPFLDELRRMLQERLTRSEEE